MGKRTPSKWLTLMAACFGLLMLYIDLFIVIVPSFSVFSRLLSRVEQPAGWLWLSRWRGSLRLFPHLPRYTPSVVQLYPLYTCSARRLAVKRCSTSLRGNDTDAATSTSLHVWMDSSVGSPSEQIALPHEKSAFGLFTKSPPLEVVSLSATRSPLGSCSFAQRAEVASMRSLRQIVYEASGGIAVVLAKQFRVGPLQRRPPWEKE